MAKALVVLFVAITAVLSMNVNQKEREATSSNGSRSGASGKAEQAYD